MIQKCTKLLIFTANFLDKETTYIFLNIYKYLTNNEENKLSCTLRKTKK